MEEALRSIPVFAKTSLHYVAKASKRASAVQTQRDSLVADIEYAKRRLRELEAKLSAMDAEVERAASKVHKIRCDVDKCRGFPIGVVGSKAVALDMCIDSVSAGPALDLVRTFQLKCGNCKTVTTTKRDPDVCSACGAPALIKQGTLYADTAVLLYK